MATDAARRLFTVDDYHRMAETGILTADDRVELLGGEIVEMTPIGSRHAACVRRLTRIFIEAVGARVVVGVQDPVTLDDLTEPQPDVWLAYPHQDDYASAHPRATDLHLVVEVADSSQARDRDLKIPRYGKTGVEEAWIVDLEADRIEVFRAPSPDGYADRTSAGRGEHLAPHAFPELRIAVEDVIGARNGPVTT